MTLRGESGKLFAFQMIHARHDLTRLCFEVGPSRHRSDVRFWVSQRMFTPAGLGDRICTSMTAPGNGAAKIDSVGLLHNIDRMLGLPQDVDVRRSAKTRSSLVHRGRVRTGHVCAFRLATSESVSAAAYNHSTSDHHDLLVVPHALQ